MKKKTLISLLLLVCGLFYIGIITDFIPYIRGPVDKITESRWPYYFVNTFSKIWIPLLIFGIYVALYRKVEQHNKNLSKKWEIIVLGSTVLLVFLIHLSLVWFSRFGITVLFQRVLINGYFLASINSPLYPELFHNFHMIVHSLGLHASDHPPGSILLLKGVVEIFKNMPIPSQFIVAKLPTPDTEIIRIYKTLQPYQVSAVLFSSFLFHFLTALSVAPIYYLSKLLFDRRTAFRSAFLWGIVPSISFFAIKLDPFYVLFPLLSMYLFIDSCKKEGSIKTFFSGVIFALGSFFTFSILPVLGLLATFALLEIKSKKVKWSLIGYFSIGIITFYVAMYLLGYNVLSSFFSILGNQAHREYLLWVIFNPYDFFFYLSIPISITFFAYSFVTYTKRKEKRLLVHLLLSFWITFLLLNFSGISRAETGRIWLPLMPIPFLLAVHFLTNTLRFKPREIILVITLIFIQVVLVEEFWVPIW